MDFPIHCLKLRVASGKLWRDAPLKDLASSLLSAAHFLFQQVLHFITIQNVLWGIQEKMF